MVNLDGRPVDRAILTKMQERLVHRGPDESGIHISEGIGLAMRRLSIIDLVSGAQPIYNEDHTKVIVFNGEIYNAPGIRSRLEALGHCFYTRSDTETIVHAYEQWGPNFLEEINGMFAFALWDARNQRLILARDRAGLKPLYYALRDETLIFASELKSLLVCPFIEHRIDQVALYEYLSFEYIPTPHCIIMGVQKLPPGYFLTYDNNGTRVQPYWDINLSKGETKPVEREGEAAAVLAQKLREVVQLELLSDVPVGLFLSGGIDSSAVAALMADIAPGRVQSFAIIFDEPSFDESRWSRMMAKTAGTEHHEMKVTTGEMIEVVPKLGWIMDEPLGDSSLIPTYLLSKFASQFVKVVLGGDGGDELFAGYSTLQAHQLANIYNRVVPRLAQAAIAKIAGQRLPVSFENLSFDFKLRRFLNAAGLPASIRHHQWLGSFTPAEKQQLLTPDFLPPYSDTYAVVDQHWQNSNVQRNINKLLYCDMKLYLEGDILHKVDRASMACSLEVRAPLLNVVLMEYAAELPYSLKLKGLTRKYILRRALAGSIPGEIIKRGKKGFNIPVAKWLTTELREMAGDLLSPEAIRKQGFFKPSYVDKLWSDHQNHRSDNRKLLWTLLAFELWYHTLFTCS